MTLTIVILDSEFGSHLSCKPTGPQAYKTANKDCYKRPRNMLHSGHLLKRHIEVGIYFTYLFYSFLINNSSLATAKTAFFWWCLHV